MKQLRTILTVEMAQGKNIQPIESHENKTNMKNETKNENLFMHRTLCKAQAGT